MISRHVAVVSLSVLAAASLALAGCKSSSTSDAKSSTTPTASASPSGTVAKDPNTVLASALAALKTSGYDFVNTSGASGSSSALGGPGSFDPAHKAAKATGKGSIEGVPLEIDVTTIGSKLWLKFNGGLINQQEHIPTGWMLLDPSKLHADHGFLDITGAGDVNDLNKMLASVSDLKMTDPNTLTGTVDLTAAAGDSKPDAEDLKKAGAAAKKASFTATLDNQGRFTDLKIAPDDKTLSTDFAFSNYGSPSAITPPPAADVKPVPAALYAVFNS